MTGRSRKKSRKNRGSRIGMLVLITVVWVMTVWSVAGGTLGKYIFRAAGSGDSLAEKFYFASDQLKPDTETAPVFDLTWWDTDQPFNFEIDIRNTVEELNITLKDIEYHVTAELEAEPSGTSLSGISVTTALKGSQEAQPWKLSGGTSAEQVVAVTLNPLSASLAEELNTVTVTVTARSSSPYIQTLKAVYRVHLSKDRRIAYYTEDLTDQLAVELYIEVRDAMPSHTAGVKITWPSVLYIDRSSELIDKLIISGNTGEGELNTGAKYRLLFMKDDPGNTWRTREFNVELSGG